MNDKQPIVEELPVAPGTQELLHDINTARYPSQLRKLGGGALFGKVRTGEIPPEELDIVNSELAAAKQRLTARSPAEPAPESTETVADGWSPSAILDTLPSPEERVYDARERAANEHNQD